MSSFFSRQRTATIYRQRNAPELTPNQSVLRCNVWPRPQLVHVVQARFRRSLFPYTMLGRQGSFVTEECQQTCVLNSYRTCSKIPTLTSGKSR